MTGLKELLTDVAAEARPYDVTDRALRTARRQRRVAWAVPIAAVVLAAAGAVAVLPRRGDAPVVVSWLPETLAPVDSAPSLPNGPVGRAGLAYLRAGGSMTLVTEDGGSYDPGEAVRSISSDGRWVALRRSGRLVLRDLIGTGLVDVGPDADTAIAAWSPDGRWVAVRTGLTDQGARRSIAIFDLEARKQAATETVENAGITFVCGLRDSTYLLMCFGADSRADVDVTTRNPLTGDDIGGETVAIPPNEATGRLFAGGQLMPDGHTLMLWTESYRPVEGGVAPGDPLTYDLNQPGSEARVHALPVPAENGVVLHPESSVDEGVLVTRRVSAGVGSGVAAIELFDLATGRLSPITTVTGDIRDIIVRGQI